MVVGRRSQYGRLKDMVTTAARTSRRRGKTGRRTVVVRVKVESLMAGCSTDVAVCRGRKLQL